MGQVKYLLEKYSRESENMEKNRSCNSMLFGIFLGDILCYEL
jgi:hypothetical protein